jgi:rare lipoprotein A
MMKLIDSKRLVPVALLGLALAACAEKQAPPPVAKVAVPVERPKGDYKIGKPYHVRGVWYYPKVDYGYRETGIASWYGPGFHGKRTANGEIYDQMDLTAAHPTLPMPSMVRVTNLENGRSLRVRINDRGPFKNGRIIDLSYRAAQLLDVVEAGTAKVSVEILDEESRQLAAIAQGREAARNAPEAVPVVAVESAPLGPVNGSRQAVRTAAASAGDQEARDRRRPKRGPVRPVRRHRAAPGDTDPNPPTPAARTLLASRSLAMARDTRAMNGWDFDEGTRTGTSTGARLDAESAPRPDGTVTQLAVRPTSIFIQAGSFLRRDYAARLSIRLSVLGETRVTEAQIDDRRFFRVRLGPVATVADADRLLDVLQSKGFDDAKLVVD